MNEINSFSLNLYNSIYQFADAEQNVDCTTVKICKIALIIFAVLLVAAGITIAILAFKEIVAATAAWIALPCFLGAGALIWLACRIKDYEDPKALAEYRDEAAQVILEEVVDNHGWANIFRYSILPPNLFTNKFNQSLADKNLILAVEFHKRATAEYATQAQDPNIAIYNIPDPAFLSEKWKEETDHLEVNIILERYNIHEFHELGIIENNQYNELLRIELAYRILCNTHDARKDHIAHTYETTIQPFQAQYLLTKEPLSDKLLEFELDRLSNHETDYFQTILKKANLEERLDQAKRLFDEACAPARAIRDRELVRIEREFNQNKQQLFATYAYLPRN